MTIKQTLLGLVTAVLIGLSGCGTEQNKNVLENKDAGLSDIIFGEQVPKTTTISGYPININTTGGCFYGNITITLRIRNKDKKIIYAHGCIHNSKLTQAEAYIEREINDGDFEPIYLIGHYTKKTDDEAEFKINTLVR